MALDSIWRRVPRLAVAFAAGWCVTGTANADPIITAGLGRDKVYTSAPIPFWLQIKSAAPLADVSAHMVGAGHLIVPCNDTTPPPCEVPTEIEADAAITWQSALTIDASGTHRPTVVLTFLNASSGMPQSVSVPLGTVEVMVPAFFWIDWAKDLAFPIALAFGAWVYRKTQQTAQSEAKRAADRIETLRMMLPLTHRYNLRHYLSMQGAAQRFYDAACKAKTAGTPLVAGARSDELTYWLCKMVLENRRMHLGVGAYYFTNRSGENLLSLSYDGFDSKFFNQETRLELASSQFVDTLQSINVLTFARYAEHLNDPAAAALAAEVRTRLMAWLPGAGRELQLIGAFARILEFEINRMYETWYATPEQLKITDELVKAVLDESSEQDRAEYTDYFTRYRAKSPANV